MTAKNKLVISKEEFDSYESVKDTFMENWYPKLEKETIRSLFLPLSKEEAITCLSVNEMGDLIKETYPLEKEKLDKTFNELLRRIEIHVEKLHNKAFFRLTSRSAKDSWYGIGQRDKPYYKHKGLVLRAIDVIRWMGDSERIFEDLLVSLHHEHVPQIVLREWIDIKKHEEFRCFILNGEMKGISQYFYFLNEFQTNYFPELIENVDFYKESILSYFETIKEAIGLKNYVLDVFFMNNKPKILELNPLCEFTDPCLFNWEQDSFEEPEFRYIKEEIKYERPTSLLDKILQKENEKNDNL
jgi:hypothetical protein